MIKIIKNHIKTHQEVLSLLTDDHFEIIDEISEQFKITLLNNKCIYWCGNGGSASDAQHLAAELVGRYSIERKSLRSLSLNSDTSVLTCIGNDYSYEKIYSRQIEGLGVEGDILVGITTSGHSKNIINAFKTAKDKSMQTIGLLGNSGGQISDECNIKFIVPSSNTAIIQELHIIIGHIICELLEKKLNLI